MNKDQFKTDILPILILTIIVCVAVVALTIVNGVTEPLIEENAEQKTLDNLSIIFPEMDAFELDENISVYTILKGNDTLGYAFEAVGQGYGGDIVIMVGIDNMTKDVNNTVTDVNIKSISIVTAKDETPGLGQKITEDEFTGRFLNATVSVDGTISNADGPVDTISGATISTEAVIETVKKFTMEKAQLIADKEVV